MKPEKKNREQLVHISKRAALPAWKSWLIRVLSVAASLILCAIIIVLFTGDNLEVGQVLIFYGDGETGATVSVTDAITTRFSPAMASVTAAFLTE